MFVLVILFWGTSVQDKEAYVKLVICWKVMRAGNGASFGKRQRIKGALGRESKLISIDWQGLVKTNSFTFIF